MRLGNLQCVGCVNGDDNTMAAATAFMRGSSSRGISRMPALPATEAAPVSETPNVIGPVIDTVVGTVQSMTDAGWAEVLGAGSTPVLYTPPSVLPPGPAPTTEAQWTTEQAEWTLPAVSGPSMLPKLLLGAGALYLAAKAGKLALGVGAVAAYLYWMNRQSVPAAGVVAQPAQSQAPASAMDRLIEEAARSAMPPEMLQGLMTFDAPLAPAIGMNYGVPAVPAVPATDNTGWVMAAPYVGLLAAVLVIGSILIKKK